MFELRDSSSSTYVMDETVKELARRVKAKPGTRLHGVLTTGGTLEPRDVQLLASTVDERGDGTDVPLMQAVTPMVASMLHRNARTEQKLRVEAH